MNHLQKLISLINTNWNQFEKNKFNKGPIFYFKTDIDYIPRITEIKENFFLFKSKNTSIIEIAIGKLLSWKGIHDLSTDKESLTSFIKKNTLNCKAYGYLLFNHEKNVQKDALFYPSQFFIPQLSYQYNIKTKEIILKIFYLQNETRQEVITKIKNLFNNQNNYQFFNLNQFKSNKIDKSNYTLKNIPSFDQWKDQITEIKNKIKKIVLSRKQIITFKEKINIDSIFQKIISFREENRYLILLKEKTNDNKWSYFLSMTPEKLFSYNCNEKKIETEAIAGSIKRGNDLTEDSLLEKKLYNSDKEQKEHYYTTLYIIQKLLKFKLNLSYKKKPSILKLKNIQHLFTKISGISNKAISPVELLYEIHCTPAVSGFPKQDALSHIEKIEPFSRNIYASSIGYLSCAQSNIAVGIRSMVIADKKATIFTGAGILEKSQPETEWEELNIKTKSLWKTFFT